MRLSEIVLRQGYVVIDLMPDKPSSINGRTFSKWCRHGWIRHEKSCLYPERGYSWERYRLTPAGRLALQESDHE